MTLATHAPHAAHVAAGPRWYRARIRALGPFVALIPPAILGACSLVLINLDKTWAGYSGLLAGVCAAPGLLAFGAPFSESSTYPVAIAGSIVFWLVVGFVAARWATRNPLATWRDYWRAYRWLALAVWIGAVAAIVIAVVKVGGLI